MAIKVKNLNGTGDKSPAPHASWLKYWEAKTGETAVECSSCIRPATLGGHVKKAGSNDNSHYITPLCDACNAKKDEEFSAYSTLVPAS